MSTTALVPIEEYLRMTDKPYREYRDGVLCPKSTPTSKQGAIQLLLGALLLRLGLHVGSEVALRMSPAKVLIPDVVVDPKQQEPYPTEPVLLCCARRPNRRDLRQVRGIPRLGHSLLLGHRPGKAFCLGVSLGSRTRARRRHPSRWRHSH